MEKGLNNFVRRKLGYFLTTGKETSETKIEHEIYAEAVRLIADELREKKIRSSTLLSKLEDINTVIETTGNKVQELAQSKHYEPLSLSNASYAYVSAILYALVAYRNEKIERLKQEQRDSETHEQRDLHKDASN